MVDLTLSVSEFREKIYKEELLQDFIRDILIIAGKDNLKRALYMIVYLIVGGKAFPKALRDKITNCMDQGIIEKTFLDRNNYEQRVYGMLNIKDKITNEFKDLYYGDVLVNLGHGSQAKKNGRGLSGKRQSFLRDEIGNYSLLQALDEIVNQFANERARDKYNEIFKARERILSLSEHFSIEDYIETVDEIEDEKSIEINDELSETEKKTLILARRGQGRFRTNVINRTKCCPFTGISDPMLLIASHIKPWRESNNRERLDGDNGFALTPTFDRLFDQGYISFDNSKRLMISGKLDEKCIKNLGIQEGMVVEKLVLSEKCKEYLEFHRKEKFKKCRR